MVTREDFRPARGWYDEESGRLARMRGEAAGVLVAFPDDRTTEHREAVKRLGDLDDERDRLIAARRAAMPYRVRLFPKLAGAPDLFETATSDAARAPTFDGREAAAGTSIGFDDIDAAEKSGPEGFGTP